VIALAWSARPDRRKRPLDTGSRCVNVNTADIATLATVPGVGEALAHRIISGRPYTKVDDLLRVSGIGARSLDELRPFVIVQGETPKRKDGESC
jgi:DNA uptake protein ComE-like DNA-binding protein